MSQVQSPSSSPAPAGFDGPTRPENFEPSGMSFEEAMAAALEGMNAADEPKTAPAPAPAQPPAAPVQPVPEVVKPAAEPEPAKAAPEHADAALQQIMKREQAIIEREQVLRENEQYIRELQSRLDAFEQAQKRFAADPAAYIRSIAPDVDPDEIAKQLWFEKLGDLAPSEYRLRKEVRGTHLELQKLRDEYAEAQKRLAEEQTRKEREAAVRQFVGSVPDENRLVKALASKNPEMAARMLLDAASMARAQTGTDISLEDAARFTEAYLQNFEPVFAPAPASENPPPPASAPNPAAPMSLRNEHTRVQPTKAPESDDDPNVKRRRALLEAGLDPNDPTFRALFED